jgi:transposase
VPLPPYAPELNPVERVWLHLREQFLSHRLLDNNATLVDACCQAWNYLTQTASNPSPTIPGSERSLISSAV